MDLSFLPKYWAYFNYGVLVTIMISASVVFWNHYWGFGNTNQTYSNKAFDLASQYLCVDFSWDTNGRSNYDCLCLDAF